MGTTKLRGTTKLTKNTKKLMGTTKLTKPTKSTKRMAPAQERDYESRRILWLDELRQDARGAVRGVMRYPIAALVAVISLAAGIGATTATLTIRDVVFRRPPPAYSHPEQLSKIQVGRPDRPIMPIGGYVPGRL